MFHSWRQVREFPSYSVSDHGHVRNDETGRDMTMLVNQSGLVHVGLTKDKKLFKRSVPLLVAEAFLVPPRHITFDTPINLNGDRFNNTVENLLWRPRWFAAKYHRQFKTDTPASVIAVEEINTHTEFESTWEAAIAYGLIDHDIRIAAIENTEIWPTYQRFRVIN